MRLESLLAEIDEVMYGKIVQNRSVPEEEAKETAQVVALSAVKYGDLSNQASKDYIFDIDRFTSSEGDTGPYILYTLVRIKSILSKYAEAGGRGSSSSAAAGRGRSGERADAGTGRISWYDGKCL